jgi:hypothetical protein
MEKYTGIPELLELSKNKKIKVIKNSWGKNGYGIVNKIVYRNQTDPYGLYCEMYVKYSNGHQIDECSRQPSGTDSWKLLEILDQPVEIEYLDSSLRKSSVEMAFISTIKR